MKPQLKSNREWSQHCSFKEKTYPGTALDLFLIDKIMTAFVGEKCLEEDSLYVTKLHFWISLEKIHLHQTQPIARPISELCWQVLEAGKV